MTTLVTTTGSVGRDLGVWAAGSLTGKAEAAHDVTILVRGVGRARRTGPISLLTAQEL